MHEYISLLFEQFCNAKGYRNISKIPFHEIEEEFIVWNVGLLRQGLEYIQYAKENGIDLQNHDAIELNKGGYDSLVSKLNRVSPFSGNTELVIYQGIPMIKSGINIVEGQVADIYHTHNPYSERYLEGLSELHGYGHKICFGIFGSIDDKDKDKKFKLVKDYLRNFNENIEYSSDTINGHYHLIVYSKFKQKILRRGIV